MHKARVKRNNNNKFQYLSISRGLRNSILLRQYSRESMEGDDNIVDLVRCYHTYAEFFLGGGNQKSEGGTNRKQALFDNLNRMFPFKKI